MDLDRDHSPHSLAVLRSINVSRPQVERPASWRSVAAKTEQASASRPASGRSANYFPVNMDDPPTPPMNPIPDDHVHPDIHPADRPGADSFLPSTLLVMERLQDGAREGAPPQLVGFDDSQVKRKPVSRPTSSRYSGARYSQLNPEVREATPGGDDGPYLRFAIDQLTRDEEVRGSRQYPANDRWTTVERPSEDRPLLAPTLFVEDSHVLEEATPAQSFVTPIERVAVVERVSAPHPQPIRYIESGQSDAATALPIAPDTFVAFEGDSHPLKFLPGILRPFWLMLFFFLCMLMLAALIFSGVWSGLHLGLWGYTQFGGPRWFVFKYLPTICGMFLLLWLFQIQIAVQRVAPYIAMASYSAKSRSEAPFMEVQPTNFLLPKLFYFRASQPIIGVCMIVFWLQIFTIPLLATVYNVYFYGSPATGSWRWAAVQGIVWTLVALYFLLLVALVLLALWLWRQRTGLKWDPRSLAELIALLDRSNITKHYDNSETFRTPKDFRERLSYRSDRLGYWTSTRRPNDVFYAIGDDGGEVPRHLQASMEANRFPEKRSASQDNNRYLVDQPVSNGQTVTNLETGDDMYAIQHRYIPWYLRTPFVLLWCVGAFALYLAFLIVSFINHAVLYGFKPALPVAPNPAAFSATNFFYGFIPAFFAQFFFLCWLSVDFAFRRLQPYVSMSDNNSHGAHAANSLLLDYPYRLPFSVTFAAILGNDLHVAWFSLMSLIAATIPVLAGGCFFSQFYVAQQMVRVSVDSEGYYALCVALGLYALSFPLILFGLHKRRLPHAVTTISEQISWLYSSRLLGERELRSPGGNKVEMTTRLLAANTERERELDGGRFEFGKVTGRDGRQHLGIERVGRGDGKLPMSERTLRTSRDGRRSQSQSGTPYGEKLVEVEEPLPTAYRGNDNAPQYSSAPSPAYAGGNIDTAYVSPAAPGPAPGISNAPVVASRTMTTAQPVYYDPYARPETTGATGFPVPRELASPVSPVAREFEEVRRDEGRRRV